MNILNIIKATIVKLKNKEKLRSAKTAIVDSKDVFEGSNFIGKNAVVKDCQIGFASYVAYESHIEHCQIGKYCCIGPYVRTITGKHPIEFAAMGGMYPISVMSWLVPAVSVTPAGLPTANLLRQMLIHIPLMMEMWSVFTMVSLRIIRN